jgi:signal transduction histidine kinase
LRLRLTAAFIFIAIISVTSVVLIARQGALREVQSFMLRGGMTGADELVETLAAYYSTNGSWAGVDAFIMAPGSGQGQGRGLGMGGMHDMMAGQRLRVADALGNVVADSNDPNPSELISRDLLEQSLPIHVEGQTVGYLLTEGGMSFGNDSGNLLAGRISRAALYAGLIAIALSIVLAFLLAYNLMRPVRELTLAASSISEGDLSQRVPVPGNDELGTLGVAFNRMADSLQQAEESRRAMTADIAHELRNPLAVQRANLEALQDGIYPLTPDNLNPILEQNQLLARLVDDLRTLALVDSGNLDLIRQPTNIPDLIARLVERFSPQAAARQVQISIEQTADIPLLNVDPQRIDQILSNLMSNALRHTPDTGLIAISLHRDAQQVSISVWDSGSGIPAEALEQVFTRFYRGDRSRSRAEGGTGLGLAIARQLAQAHGGDLTAANHPTGGAIFTLTLPVD